jgi:hypothetical protein
MVFEQIEQLKRQYTDKYVMVDASQPELARFGNRTGQVKTVNMSGRALVEFDGGDNNIGWFDIGLDFLKIVDKPLPRAEIADKKPAQPKAAPAAKPAASAAPAGEKKPSVAELARAGGAAKKSTADILAAARGKADATAPKASAPAASPKPAAQSPAAPASGKLSTADILAAARGKAAAKAAQAAPPKEAPAVEEATPKPEAVAEVAVEETPPAAAPAAPKSAKGALPTATADIIAWCREHDAKG